MMELMGRGGVGEQIWTGRKPQEGHKDKGDDGDDGDDDDDGDDFEGFSKKLGSFEY